MFFSFLLFFHFPDDTCNDKYFSCDGRCISQALVCNGKKNCPNGLDEEKCGVTDNAIVGKYVTILL
jgi:hypothetical protein